jgi:hypothetical protein
MISFTCEGCLLALDSMALDANTSEVWDTVALVTRPVKLPDMTVCLYIMLKTLHHRHHHHT